MSTEKKSQSKSATKVDTAGSEEKPKSGNESQDVILRMIELNSSGDAKRWNSGDNITFGFINIRKIEAVLKIPRSILLVNRSSSKPSQKNLNMMRYSRQD
jgi:hypothetical protein